MIFFSIVSELMLKEESIVLKIFSYLDDKSLSNCRGVNTSWFNFVSGEKFFWRRVFHECEEWLKIVEKCNSDKIEILGNTFLEELGKWETFKEMKSLETKSYQEILRNHPILITILTKDLDLIKEIMSIHQWKDGIQHNVDLYYACIKKLPVTIYKFLVDKTRRPFSGSVIKEPLLNIAAYWGNLDICKLIISRSGSIPTEESTGRNALHTAAMKGHSEIVEHLIQEFRHMLNYCDNFGESPLYHAAENGHSETCQLLLDLSRGEMDKKNDSGITPIKMSVLEGKSNVFQVFINYMEGNINLIETRSRKTFLHDAAEKGHAKICQMILDKIPPEERQPEDSIGYTPLHYAVRSGQWRTCQVLLNYIDIETVPRNPRGRTLLHIAADGGHFKTMEVLLNHYKNDINPQDDLGCTPFLRAAASGHVDICQLLIDKKGKNLNSPDQNAWNYTPLHYAAQYGYFRVCKLIIEKTEDWDVNATDEKGWTPLHGAALNGFLETCKLILEHTENYKPVDINLRTPLHMAAQEGQEEVIQFLIEQGQPEDLLKQDKFGMTPFHETIKGGYVEASLILMEASPEEIFHLQDENGNTPLHTAFETREFDLDLCKMIISTMPGPFETRNKEGKRPRDVIFGKEHSDKIYCALYYAQKEWERPQNGEPVFVEHVEKDENGRPVPPDFNIPEDKICQGWALGMAEGKYYFRPVLQPKYP